MNKFQLMRRLADEIRFGRPAKSNLRVARIAVETIVESMKRALLKGERIEIRGFGSFTIRHYGAYEGKNPKTKQTIQVKPKRLPHFKVGKELREMLSQASKEGV
jgi:integration host factor subunit beta